MQKVIFLLSMLVVAGCGTTPMSYKPAPMGLTDSIGVIDKLTMTQHPAWRPDYVEIKDKYILWDYGRRTSGRGSGIVVGNVAVGRISSTTREVGERLYYDQIQGVVLNSWSRKMSQWYAVSIRNSAGNDVNYVFRTRNLGDAKRFVDAMHTVIAYYKKDAVADSEIAKPDPYGIEKTESSGADIPPDPEFEGIDHVYNELIKLDELRERGILSDGEFDAEKKKALEGN